MHDTDDEQTGEYALPRTGSGSLTEHPHDRYRQLFLFGLPLHTDRWGLRALFEAQQFAAETVSEDDEPTLIHGVEDYYPGFLEAVGRGMRELRDRDIRAGHIVFLNGQVQVWPEAAANALPSDFYPTRCQGAPGYEAEIEAAAKAREEAAEREHQATMAKLEDEFLTALAVKPRELLENVRSLAVHYKRMELTDGPLMPMIRKHIVPWLTGGADNRLMAEQVLGPIHYGNDGQPAGLQEDCRWILEA